MAAGGVSTATADSTDTNVMSTSINNDVNLKGRIGSSVIKIYEKFLNILVRVHKNTMTALPTSISTNVCKVLVLYWQVLFTLVLVPMFVKVLVLYGQL